MASIVSLNRKKGSLKAQLTRIETSLQDKSIEWTKIKIDSKLKNLEKTAYAIDALRTEYFNIVPENEDTSEIEESLIDLEARIDNLEVSLNQLLTPDSKTEKNEKKVDSVSANYKIRLPEIPLPQFSGKYEEWSIFKTEFNNIVSNNDQLTDVQRLYYLRAALQGQAKLLENPEDTFKSLFTALENRFENKRIIVNIHIKAILEFEKITHESAKELSNLVDTINKNMRALNTLGFERNELSDIFISTIILDKLDKESRKQYELSINTSEVPEFDDLISYLEKLSHLAKIKLNLFMKTKQNLFSSAIRIVQKKNVLFVT